MLNKNCQINGYLITAKKSSKKNLLKIFVKNDDDKFTYKFSGEDVFSGDYWNCIYLDGLIFDINFFDINAYEKKPAYALSIYELENNGENTHEKFISYYFKSKLLKKNIKTFKEALLLRYDEDTENERDTLKNELLFYFFESKNDANFPFLNKFQSKKEIYYRVNFVVSQIMRLKEDSNIIEIFYEYF